MAEEIKNDCKHDVTYLIPMANGYVEKCMDCEEVVNVKKEIGLDA